MADLLYHFLNPMKLFQAVASDFMKSLWRRMGGGKGRKMTGGSATADQVEDQVEDRRKSLKQKLFQTIFYQKSCLLNVTLNI
jgi:hypothetical protein